MKQDSQLELLRGLIDYLSREPLITQPEQQFVSEKGADEIL